MENPVFEDIRRLVAMIGRGIIVSDFSNFEMMVKFHLENTNDDIQRLFE